VSLGAGHPPHKFRTAHLPPHHSYLPLPNSSTHQILTQNHLKTSSHIALSLLGTSSAKSGDSVPLHRQPCLSFRLFNMASSPSTPQSATWTRQSSAAQLYRQLDYFDGKDVCIVESRRRRHVSRAEGSAPSLIHSRDSNEAVEPRVSMLSGSWNRPSQMEASSSSEASDPRTSRHVTSRPRGTKAKTVSIQAPLREDRIGSWVEQQAKVQDVLTPPPTPKISRLPTPELEDVGNVRFCSCCAGEDVVRFCSWCGKKLDGVTC